VLAPVLPTHEMVTIGADVINDNGGNARWSDIREAWNDMLEAAPEVDAAKRCDSPNESRATPPKAVGAVTMTEPQKDTIRFAADALEGLDYEDTAGDLRAILKEAGHGDE
jgi:hypothetical protein